MSLVHLLLVLAIQQPDTITLEQALSRAAATRPLTVAAGATVAQARGALRVAGIITNPTIQLERADFPPTRRVSASQPLSWLLRRGADRAAGFAGVARATADSAQVIADLGKEVRRSFFAALAGDERFRLVQEQGAIVDSLLSLAERRVEAGDISVLERDQVAQEAGRTQLLVSRARESSEAARFELARAVAWEELNPPMPKGELDLNLDSAASEPEVLTGEQISQLPFVRAATADSAAAAARLRSARLAQVPVPALMAGRESGGTPDTVQADVILGLAFPLPLWSQGREAVAVARASAVRASAMTAEARLEIRVRLEGARVRLRESAARARLARDSLLPAARELRAGTIRVYEAGRTGILPVFEALRAERDIALTMVQELQIFQEARAELSATLGRWE